MLMLSTLRAPRQLHSCGLIMHGCKAPVGTVVIHTLAYALGCDAATAPHRLDHEGGVAPKDAAEAAGAEGGHHAPPHPQAPAHAGLRIAQMSGTLVLELGQRRVWQHLS